MIKYQPNVAPFHELSFHSGNNGDQKLALIYLMLWTGEMDGREGLSQPCLVGVTRLNVKRENMITRPHEIINRAIG